MQMRKGPYGNFIVHTLDEKEELFSYAYEIIENNRMDNNFVTVFENNEMNNRELLFDFSNLSSLSEICSPTNKSDDRANHKIKNLTHIIRLAIANLFLSALSCLNHGLPVEGIVLDSNCIFVDLTNKKNPVIKFTYLPLVYDMTKMSLDSIDLIKVQNFLNSEIINSAISDKEKDTILHLISTNNESGLHDFLLTLTSDKNQNVSFIDSLKKHHTILLIIVALICFPIIFNFALISYIMIFLCLGYIFYLLIRNTISQKLTKSKSNSFDTISDNLYFSPDKSDENYVFPYACLCSTYKINGQYINKSILSDTLTIGSDCFLSDITIESPEVSPLHARIDAINNTFFLTDLSNKNETYLENKKLVPNKKYELKNQQLISFGDVDFKFIMQ